MAGSVFDKSLLSVRRGPSTGPLTFDEHTRGAIEAEFDPAALEEFLKSGAGSLRLPLTADPEGLVTVEKVIARGERTITLAGKVQGDSFSDVLLVFHDGAVHGSVVFLDTNTHYQFAMTGDGGIAIRELDTETFQAPCGDPGESPVDEDITEADPDPADGEVAGEAPAGSLVVDTVVGYDKAARIADGGVAAIESRIIASVDRMNDAIGNSQAGNSFVSLLATIEDPDYVFPGAVSGNMGSADELGDLNSTSDGDLDTVSQLRIDLGADQNTFVVKNSDGSAGIAYRPGKSMIVARDYMTSTRLTFSHEFGHNIGCHHSWGDSSSDLSTSRSDYGWRLDPPGSSPRVRTIMAYDWGWGSGARIPYFSNPNVFYNGAATGAVNGYDATGDATADQRYVSGGYTGTAGSGFDGTHAGLGANNAGYISSFAITVADNATRKAIAVLDPALSVTWLPGETRTIYWLGGDHTDEAVISLHKGGVLQSVIASGISGEDRWYDWNIPSNLAGGSDYYIRVTVNGSGFDDSSNFTIGAPPTVVINSPGVSPVGLPTVSQRLLLEATTSGGIGSGAASFTWSKVSGPGSASFENPNEEDTSVQFSTAGTYVLRLSASKGGLIGTADLTVSVGPVVSNAGLSLHYTFDQTAGDSSGNGNDAIITGSHDWTDGQIGNAVLFSQSPAYADSSTGIAISNATGVSASAWVRMDSAGTDNRYIMRQNTGGGIGRSWLYVGADGNLKSFIGNAITGGVPFSLGVWHHVALAAGGGSVRIYLDGVQVATSNLSPETCSGVVRIGQQETPGTDFQWLGAIDEARVYQRILTADEITALAAFDNGPAVSAGPDAAALTGISTTLAGNAADDGVPESPVNLTYQWVQVSGPAAASIPNPGSPAGSVTFPVAGSYVLRLICSDEIIQTADDVTWTVTDPSPGQQWRFTYFGTAGNSGDAADDFDFDKDGLVNLLERAFGTIPTDAASHLLPEIGRVDISGAPGMDYLSISYPRLSGGNAPAGNDYTSQQMTYVLEHNSGFTQPWDDSGFILLDVTPPVDGVETATFRRADPVEGDDREFLRLKVISQ